MYKNFKYRFIIMNLVLAVMWISAYSAETSCNTAASILNAYKSENGVTRRTALRSLEDVVSVDDNAAVTGWVSDLLATALQDESPVVVSVAVEMVGKFKVTGLNKNLITLYQDIGTKFSSAYADRVRYAIIPALGKLGGDGAADLLKKLLAEDNGSVMGESLLSAIVELNDASLVSDIRLYKTKMQKMVTFATAKNYDPLIYSRMQRYTAYALEVENLLLKGGK